MADSGKLGCSASSAIHGEKREKEKEEQQQLQNGSTAEKEVEDEEELKLPSGFRFHPTDCELVVNFLMNKIFGRKQPINIIKEIGLFQYDPHQLPIGEFKLGKKNEAYYYTHIEQKYWHDIQQQERTTPTGHWKATGEEDEVIRGGKIVGLKKIFVFYEGRKAPTETRTVWRMHEYSVHPNIIPIRKTKGCVICRIWYKDTCDMPSSEEGASEYDVELVTDDEFSESSSD